MRLFPKFVNPLLITFLLSGTAGLIYEVVWTRWLTSLLGSASAATAIVLAVFMAGIGIGAWLAAQRPQGLVIGLPADFCQQEPVGKGVFGR